MAGVRWRWTALAVVAALMLGAIGCGSGETGTDVKKVALVVPGGDNDPDWSLQAMTIVDDFPRQLGVRVDIADASRTSDVRGALEQLSHEGNQLVITDDSRYADDAEAVAATTKVPELVWGERQDPPDGLIGQVTVQDKESGYMAGLLAARAAITGRLGVVVAADGSDWDLAMWNRMAGGFVAGARSVDPKTQIAYAQVGSDGDATSAEMSAATRRMLAHGAQMIFILGGKTTIGAQNALEETNGAGETLFIGAGTDKSSTVRLEEGGVPFMLGSIIFEPRKAFRAAVHDVRAGTFADHRYPLTIRNGGMQLYTTGRAPKDALEAALEAGRRMSAGTLEVPSTATSGAVEALNAGSAPAQG